MSEVKLSVLIVTWNSSADIDACVDSLNFCRPFEVIVVDNASADNTRDKLRQHHNLLLVLNDSNAGYARANNQAARMASGEYILLLNPDTRVELGALDTLAEFLDSNPDFTAVAPRLINPDGSTQLSIRGFPTFGSVLWELTGLPRLLPRCRAIGGWRMRSFDYDSPAEVPQPMASCLMLRRAVWNELGGFDESFPIFYNDVDLSRRLAAAGHRTWYLPQTRVIHRVGASTSQVRTRMFREAARSLFRYLRKHDRRAFWLKAIILMPLLELSTLARTIAWRLRRRSGTD
ncbi:MAG: glycosyltransferase family 2 protein [candidate division WOR-3 bacterium]